MFAALALAGLLINPPTQRIGLALNVPEPAGPAGFMAAMRKQIRLGLDGENISLKWDEYETSSKGLEDGINGAVFMGQQPLLTISTIDTVRRRVPADIATTPWDDPKFEHRFDAFLQGLAPKLKDKVGWISLGNEVNVYLAQHPDETASYLKFLAHERELLHGLLPGVPVGVTVTCADGQKAPEIVKALQEGMDVTVFTYYPLDGFKVQPLSEVPKGFEFMLSIAGSRPMLLQEIGYPASPLNGSSEDQQAQFVSAVFDQLKAHQDQIPLGCFFIQGDFSEAQLSVLDTYYGVNAPEFHAFLGSLGLCDAKGKPRKAWAVFTKECLGLKPVQ